MYTYIHVFVCTCIHVYGYHVYHAYVYVCSESDMWNSELMEEDLKPIRYRMYVYICTFILFVRV